MELTGYEVLYRARNNASTHWETTLICNSTLNVTLKNLEKYTEYEIKLSAFNKQGPGNFSEVVTCFTDEDGKYKVRRFVLNLVVKSLAELWVVVVVFFFFF